MTTSRARKTAIPSNFNVSEAERLLKASSREAHFSTRIDTISRSLLGRPYAENSLAGGPEVPEVLTISLYEFDCVTYIETVLGLALSRNVIEVIKAIRQMRYEGGEVEWRRRNHFMVDWARNNEMRGTIENLTRGAGTVEKTRTLSSIPGLSPRQATFRCFPKRRLPQVSRASETGDIILFASTRRWLDVFHVGLLIRQADRLLMRHATRTAGRVIEQDLTEFIRNNRMSGFMLLRPVHLDA